MLIFLIGFMCSGKTTLGQAIARECSNARFIDLDEYIQQQANLSVTDIFASWGEKAFRQLEHLALRSLIEDHAESTSSHLIVACGGGTPCFFNNMDLMNANGTTVWLVPDNDVLLSRLRLGRATRPLLAKMDDAELAGYSASLLCKRRPHYSKAAHVFNSSLLETPEQITQTAKTFIQQFL